MRILGAGAISNAVGQAVSWLGSQFGGRPTHHAEPRQGVRAGYDNAATTSENQRQWATVDYFSPKAANSYHVRRMLRGRSRHEVSNNPYLYGVANSNADDLIGSGGPTIQVRTSKPVFDRAVEDSWNEWCREVGLAEKLRTCKLAKTVDGEGFLILKTVADLEHPVKLYPVDVEADQVTSWTLTANTADQWVDGLTLHPVTGRPTHYHVLRSHPGDLFFPAFDATATDKIQARHVIHWFAKFRPGQVRGIPAFTSSLDLFAEGRAYRKSVIKAAEIAADYAAVLETDLGVGDEDGDDEDSGYTPFKRVPINRGSMAMLPPKTRMHQFDPKQPTTSYADFTEKLLGEAFRPLNYPLNLALGTSQKFNFSSAKLDHINYRNALVVERNDCVTAVLGPIFRAWYEEAVLTGAIPLHNGLKVPPVEWHWPGFEPLDPLADAQTDAARLAGGTETLREFWAKRGRDWQEVLAQLKAEKDECERLGLTFGDVVKRTVTQTEDATAEPAHAD